MFSVDKFTVALRFHHHLRDILILIDSLTVDY